MDVRIFSSVFSVQIITNRDVYHSLWSQDIYFLFLCHLLSLTSLQSTQKYRMFQKEFYNFESLYKFIQRTCHPNPGANRLPCVWLTSPSGSSFTSPLPSAVMTLPSASSRTSVGMPWTPSSAASSRRLSSCSQGTANQGIVLRYSANESSLLGTHTTLHIRCSYLQSSSNSINLSKELFALYGQRSIIVITAP
jgi:hypothetical protein